MVVLELRCGESRRVASAASGIAVRCFHYIPPVVDSASRAAGRRGDIDFFKLFLSHVGDIEIARLAVKTEAPGIAQTEAPDFPTLAAVTCKWIGRRNTIGRCTLRHVDAQQLAQQLIAVLRPIGRVTSSATIAKTDIEKAIGSESNHAAVVI